MELQRKVGLFSLALVRYGRVINAVKAREKKLLDRRHGRQQDIEKDLMSLRMSKLRIENSIKQVIGVCSS
jgi:hypothetical protein